MPPKSNFYELYNFHPENNLYSNISNQLLVSIKTTPEMLNITGALHGAAINTMIENITTVNLLLNDKNLRESTSVDLNCSYLRGTMVDQEIFILSESSKIGKNLGFTQVWLYNSKLEKLAQGKHIKAFLTEKFVI